MKMEELLDKKPTPDSRTTTLCILGQKGTGKTFAMAIMGDHLDCRTLYFDTVGALTVKRLVKPHKGPRATVYMRVNSLDRQKVIQAVEGAFKQSDRVVLDMGNLLPREKVFLVDFMSAWLMQVGNTAVFLDEVAFICPQSSRIYSDEFHRLVMAGRNENVVPVVFSTQRSQTAHKDVLALADKYLFFRLIHNLDRQKVRDLVGLKPDEWEELESQLMTLEKKEAFLFYTEGGNRVLKRVVMPDYKGGVE